MKSPEDPHAKKEERKESTEEVQEERKDKYVKAELKSRKVSEDKKRARGWFLKRSESYNVSPIDFFGKNTLTQRLKTSSGKKRARPKKKRKGR